MAAILRDSPKPFVGDKAAIARVRCVLMQADRYLLAQHNSRRRGNPRPMGATREGASKTPKNRKPACVASSSRSSAAAYPISCGSATGCINASSNASSVARSRNPSTPSTPKSFAPSAGSATRKSSELAVGAQVADGLRARRHHRVSALARRPSLTAIVRRRRLPPLMESHVIKYLPSAERAVRMLSIRSSQSPLASFGRTTLTWLAPTSICTGGFLS